MSRISPIFGILVPCKPVIARMEKNKVNGIKFGVAFDGATRVYKNFADR